MDPREIEALAKRLGENATDTEALNAAYAHGQSDPRGYAVFLEKAGAASTDPASGAHWYCEAANVWTTSLNDAHRAERALVHAVDTDPLSHNAVTRLVALHAEKSNTKGIAALHQRRTKNLERQLSERPELAPALAEVYCELARVFSEELQLADKALEAYKKAASHNPQDPYAIYQARELLKSASRWKEALPYFAAERALIQGDPARQAALFADEAEVCRQAGEIEALVSALRGARSVDGSDDPGLKQQLAAVILEQKQAGKAVSEADVDEATALFVSLAETYDGEYGHSYALCALELDAGNDRAAQLAMYYGEQIGKLPETAYPAAAYLAANPEGAVAEDARQLVASSLGGEGDQVLISALTPAKNAPDAQKVSAFGTIARALVQSGRDEEAVSYYQQIAEISPADDESVSFLAAKLRGKNDLALRDLLLTGASVTSAPHDLRHAWLSEVADLCEGALVDVKGAIEARRQLVLMDPSDDEAADHLEATLEAAEQWDDLAELIARRAEVDPNPHTKLESLLRAASIHRDRRGDKLAAAEATAAAVRLEPDEEARAFDAVDLYVAADNSEKARALLQALLGEILAGDARSNYSRRLGELLEAAGQFAEAGGAYAEAASGLSDVDLWEQAQDCFVQCEAWGQAARSTSERRALVEDPSEKAELAAEEANYLEKLGDTEAALLCLKEALECDPSHAKVASRLERAYVEQNRHGELVSLLLARAELSEDVAGRVSMRKRAAFLQRDQLSDLEGMEQALLLVLSDEEDLDSLRVLADIAQDADDRTLAVSYLRRLEAALGEEGRGEVALRLAQLLEAEDDQDGALEQYLIALNADAENVAILSAVADLQRAIGDQEASATSYEKLLGLTSGDQKLATARCLADLQADLNRTHAAIASYKIVLELDEDDFDAVERVRDLAEKVENWEDFAKYHEQLMEMEGDEDEASAMALRLAEVLATKLNKPSEALLALVPFARAGDAECRAEYERLGDSLGRQAEVAESLVEWMQDAPAGPARSSVLRSAYDRFLEVKKNDRAIEVGLELVRMKGASEELAKSLEETATPAKNIDALQAAFTVLGKELSGPPRAEELVRQAEVLAQAGLAADEAVQHGEQALTSAGPDGVEQLLTRLAVIAGPKEGAIGVYERQVSRCKSPEDRVFALCRAAEVAAIEGDDARVKRFFEVALQTIGPGEPIDELRARVRQADEKAKTKTLRKALAEVLATGGRGARDGGKSWASYLAKAASVSYQDLKDVEAAFTWLTQSLTAHAEEETLDLLEEIGAAEKTLNRVAEVIGLALDQVHDGPLVRMLLRRRYTLRSEKLGDEAGAAADLKKLYDLSPADTDIADKLEEMYRSANDQRGLVQLYEDQILRGRDQAVRADLARKVALIWQDGLEEPREAADAWRRVLRMKSGDTEAKEGLDRAKQGMRRVSAKEVAEAEKQNRREVEARKAAEIAEFERVEEERARKAAELQARHSQPPPPLDDEEENPVVIGEAPPPLQLESELTQNVTEDETFESESTKSAVSEASNASEASQNAEAVKAPEAQETEEAAADDAATKEVADAAAQDVVDAAVNEVEAAESQDPEKPDVDAETAAEEGDAVAADAETAAVEKPESASEKPETAGDTQAAGGDTQDAGGDRQEADDDTPATATEAKERSEEQSDELSEVDGKPEDGEEAPDATDGEISDSDDSSDVDDEVMDVGEDEDELVDVDDADSLAAAALSTAKAPPPPSSTGSVTPPPLPSAASRPPPPLAMKPAGVSLPPPAHSKPPPPPAGKIPAPPGRIPPPPGGKRPPAPPAAAAGRASVPPPPGKKPPPPPGKR